MPTQTTKYQYWCFTLNNPTEEQKTDVLDSNLVDSLIKYAVWQVEIGAEGTEHLQGYVEFANKKRLTQCRILIPGAHWEHRIATADKARKYCMKTDTQMGDPIEIGTWDPQTSGKRNDLLDVKRKLDEGATDVEIAEEHFGSWVRYHKSFNSYKRIKSTVRNWKTHVIVLICSPGNGKSRWIRHHAGSSAYWAFNGKWFDDYDGTSDVILDDFYGWIPYSSLLRMLDEYPFKVECKGDSINFAPKRIFISSNSHPLKWYDYERLRIDADALLRRIDCLLEVNADANSYAINYSDFASSLVPVRDTNVLDG